MYKQLNPTTETSKIKMLKLAQSIAVGSIMIASLLSFDAFLGNGFTDMIKRIFCICFCFVKKTLKDHLKLSGASESTDFNATVFTMEIIALLCTMLLLNRYKKYGIESSKEVKGPQDLSLSQERMSRRRVSRSMDFGPQVINDPQLIKPFNLEMPVLQMAIIDTIGTTRSQPERGDAGDVYNITDSAILSITSLLDTDFKLQDSLPEDNMVMGDRNTVQVNSNRCLWDVVEEE